MAVFRILLLKGFPKTVDHTFLQPDSSWEERAFKEMRSVFQAGNSGIWDY